MESPKKLRKVNGSRIALLMVLLGCACVVAWSQDFETNVQGSATACGKSDSYNKPGGGSVRVVCSNSSGFGESSALAGFPISALAGSVTAENGSANAVVTAFDIATLIPPAGFDDTSVTFTVTEFTGWNAEEAGAEVVECFYFGTIKSDCGTYSSGKGTSTLTKSVTVTKSSSGFQFPFKAILQAWAKAGKNKLVSAGIGGDPDPYFTLPKGWTCTWASGYDCPGTE